MKTENQASPSGFRRITRLDQPVQMRLLGFVLVVVCGTILVGWVTRTTWRQLEQLQREHAAVQGESFYLGVSMRGSIRSLNDKLLQFNLNWDPQLRSAFLMESQELASWIQTNQLRLENLAKLQLLKTVDVSRHLALLKEAQRAYSGYLTNTAHLLTNSAALVTNSTALATNTALPAPEKMVLDTSAQSVRAQDAPAQPEIRFAAVYKQVREASSEFVTLSDSLVDVQREGFREFLVGTQDTLADHQRLLKLTSVVILALGAALSLLVYRGMITPLRVGLSHSKSIIERQEKLASLGILASGVAHEIRNPLTAIKFRLFSLRKATPAIAASEDARMIAEEITRLERIVRDFLQFARPSQPELARISARQILQETQNLMAPHLERAAVQLLVEAGENVWVYADANQIKQVLINLIRNAAESIGRNGQITLALRREEAEFSGRDRPAIILSVSDTGKGIPPNVEARLFDPFFTTKERGTGLGLAISARIVENHGGVLRYETELDRGTTFEVLLPEVEQDATKHTANRR